MEHQTPVDTLLAAANPSHGGGGGAPPPSHPSYEEMIIAAIQWNRSQGIEGSSKQAIADYINDVYDLPFSHLSLLTQPLERLKNSGQIFTVGYTYLLSSAFPLSPPPLRSAPAPAAPDLSPPLGSTLTKRGRGRPPKQKPTAPVYSDPETVFDNGSGSGSEPSRKRRGRPPKLHQEGAVATEVPFVQPISEVVPNVVNGEASSVGQKRRGRPPKLQSPQPLAVMQYAPAAAPETPKRRPGRPPKNVSYVVAPETPKRRPGRPPKNASNVMAPVKQSVEGSVKPRGRPRKNVWALVVSTRSIGKRPRGRPRKIRGAVSGALGVGIGIGMGMRRGRGRPPKGGGPSMVRRPGMAVSGRKKDASIPRSHTAGQDVVNEGLLRKFVLIQSKIREAVIVIRPCVSDESPAMMALQQLEELATEDLTAPPETWTMPPTPAVPVSIVPASTASPTANASAPFTGAPFTVNVPPMNVSTETQHPMSWFTSNEARS